MKNKEIKQLFEADRLNGLAEDAEKKEALKTTVKKEAKEIKIRPAAGWFELLVSQIRFLDGRVFLAQLLLLIAAVFFLKMTGKREGTVEAEIYFAWGSGLGMLLGIFVTAGYKRIVSAKLAELTESCFFHVRQNCIFSMLIYGGIDLGLLTVFLLFTGRNTQRELWEIGIYLFVPFLVSNCFYLFLLLLGTGGKGSLVFGGGSILFAVFFLTLLTLPDIYEKTACSIWYVSGLVSIAVFTAEIKLFLNKVKAGDILCIN